MTLGKFKSFFMKKRFYIVTVKRINVIVILYVLCSKFCVQLNSMHATNELQRKTTDVVKNLKYVVQSKTRV